MHCETALSSLISLSLSPESEPLGSESGFVMGRRKFSVEDNGATATDDLRCRRSDGRRWRCPMPSLPNINYCEHHRFLALRAADSQKTTSDSELPKPNRILDLNLTADLDHERLNRTFDPLPRRRKKRRRRENGVDSELRTVDQGSDRSVMIAVRAETDLDLEKLSRTLDSLSTNKKRRKRKKGASGTKRGKETEMKGEKGTDSDPISKDLIRMAVKRQMERREEKEEKKRSEKQTEVRRNLPNGVMAISSSPVKNSSNVDQIIDKKIGLGLGSDESCSLRRRFRSKNLEPEPVGLIKKFPRVLGRSRNICHGCGENKTANCTRKSCKSCIRVGAEDSGFKESTHGQNKFSRIRYADYFICQLRPVLKQLNWDQIFELEIEASNQGRKLAGVQLQVIECSHGVQFKCNYCRVSIVNLHRSCSKCCYKICLSCCREIRGENSPEAVELVTREYPTDQKACELVAETPTGTRKELPEFHSPMAHEWTDKNSDDSIPCPPSELGGCGDGILKMKFLLPFGWVDKPDSAEQSVLSYDPEGCMNGR